MRAALYRLAKGSMSYRRPLWLAAQRFFGRREVTVTDRATDLTFRCLNGADRILGDVFHARLYDVPMVPVRPGDLVLDIGANHGFASCYFAWRGARVIAFEPSPRVFALLERNIAGNGFKSRIAAHRAAVTGRDGSATLLETTAHGGGMSTLEPAFARAAGVAYDAGREVETRSISTLLAALPQRVRLLKLDCEGSELAILEALGEADLARLDAVALEYHPTVYPLERLVEVLLGWRGFHLAKLSDPELPSAILHLVRSEAVREWSRAPG